ncbi:MAG: N-acetylmuramoyl-L-alanine amidase family protein [Bacillota bacterium]
MKSLIVIDPGHGGKDPGAVGENIQEKEVVLDISKMLKEELEEAGLTVLMTRDYDNFISLEKRAKYANAADADYFISIHNNAVSDINANGIETYHHPNSVEGQKIAEQVQDRMVRLLKRRDRGLKTAKFAVLKNTQMPAILAEVGFISNPEEQELMKTCKFKYMAAKAIAQGLLYHIRRKENE